MARHKSTRGVLLAMEGIDGAGKTTQIRLLEQRLTTCGVPHVVTKEPTDGFWGSKIRESAQTRRMTIDEELAAFINDRREHVQKVIAPALQEGKIVLIDRYYFSTVAYQGARGMNPEEILEKNSFAPSPDVLVILDVDPATGLRRIRERGDSADLFEKEEELALARDIFLKLDVDDVNSFVLDGRNSIGDIHDEIWSTLSRLTDRVFAAEECSPEAGATSEIIKMATCG
ncbi:MAG: dTMP kinase [Myxococcota bacterium]